MKARELATVCLGWKTLLRLLVVAVAFFVLDLAGRYFGPVGGDAAIGCPVAYQRISRMPPPLKSSRSFDATKLAADVGIYWALAVLWSLRARSTARRRRPSPRKPKGAGDDAGGDRAGDGRQ